MPGFSTEHTDGRIPGTNGKWYYEVTKDAANLFILLSEVSILRTGFLHTVKTGDTLSKIAREFDAYDSELVQKIYATNKDAIGNNPNSIHPG